LGAGFIPNAITVEVGSAGAKYRCIAATAQGNITLNVSTDPAVVAVRPGDIVPSLSATATVPDVYALPVPVGQQLVDVVSRELKPNSDA
jgi:hypothetical protein